MRVLGFFIIACGLLTVPCFSAMAQRLHSASDEMTSFNWGIIGMVSFKKVDEATIYPVYNDEVKRFDNRTFRLTGYMIPMKGGAKQSNFLISTLPINQCYFCGKNGNPIMVIVHMKEPVRFTFKAVTVEGRLKLDNSNAYYSPPVYLNEAVLVE